MTRVWESWVYWAYGASFDRQTERQAPAAGLKLFESRFVHDELIKLLGAWAWVRFWHGTDIKLRPLFGRHGVQSGHHRLVVSISALDPERTSYRCT
jgi:hypothetical protein